MKNILFFKSERRKKTAKRFKLFEGQFSLSLRMNL